MGHGAAPKTWTENRPAAAGSVGHVRRPGTRDWRNFDGQTEMRVMRRRKPNGNKEISGTLESRVRANY
jgi:hypothetical protein